MSANQDAARYTTLAGEVIAPNVSRNYLEAVECADGSAGGRGPAYRASADRAHFYVQAMKFGTLFVKTDWPLKARFKVNPKWFDDLVARGKLSRDEWLSYAADYMHGFSTRKRNYDCVSQYEKERALEEDSAALRAKIAERKPKRPWRPDLIQEAQQHMSQFNDVDDRATILCLWGPSRSGKTRMAMSDLFGGNPYKVDVGDTDALNIDDWDHRKHTHLVLDNVNSSSYIMKHRHVLMGPPEKVALGQSDTGMYKYNVFLGRKPIIASFDEDAEWIDKKWLTANCKVVWVGEKCFV